MLPANISGQPNQLAEVMAWLKIAMLVSLACTIKMIIVDTVPLKHQHVIAVMS